MPSLYTGTAVSGYNANPPPDDGSTGANNLITWAGIKSKVGDPLNTFAGSISGALVTSFGKTLDGAGVVSTGTNYPMTAADQGRLIVATASGITITTPDALTVGAPFIFAINNQSNGAITLAGNADIPLPATAQTVDGQNSQVIGAGAGCLCKTNGTNWFTYGLTAAQSGSGLITTPQGYLTLTNAANPILQSDMIAATAVYYSPFFGNAMPIYNGANWQNYTFSQLTLTLAAGHLASTIYDVFGFLNSGSPQIGTGPAWSNSTAGSCSRGTGGGTTELQRLSGLLTNKNIITLKNGATTYSSIPANECTYLGSIFIDGTNGQITCHTTYGQSRKWGVWNCFNRMPLALQVGDNTSTWGYITATIRPSNGATVNNLTTFTGLSEELLSLAFTQQVRPNNTSTQNTWAQIGIGFNSTTAFSGTTAQVLDNFAALSSNTYVIGVSATASYQPPVGLGINTITALETIGGTAGANFLGTQAFMLLAAQWRG